MKAKLQEYCGFSPMLTAKQGAKFHLKFDEGAGFGAAAKVLLGPPAFQSKWRAWNSAPSPLPILGANACPRESKQHMEHRRYKPYPNTSKQTMTNTEVC